MVGRCWIVNIFPHTGLLRNIKFYPYSPLEPCGDGGSIVQTNIKHHLDLEIGEDKLSEIDFSKDAIYGEIKKFLLDKYGLKVSSLYIAQVQRKHGLIERENYNFSKKENPKVPYCPEEKAIEDALKWFGMI